MDTSIIVRKVLLEAVYEYNNTIWGRNGEALRRGTYDEKRGIFYNALRRAFGTYLKQYRLSDHLNVSSISCYFRPDWTLEKFLILDGFSRRWDMDNQTHIISLLIRRYGAEGFLNNVIKTDIKDIKDFKFSF